MQKPKIKIKSKTPQENNRSSQAVVFIYKKHPQMRVFIVESGGAAGNCTPVRTVTDYSSTSIDHLNF